jgi:hypothetical protein
LVWGLFSVYAICKAVLKRLFFLFFQGWLLLHQLFLLPEWIVGQDCSLLL